MGLGGGEDAGVAVGVGRRRRRGRRCPRAKLRRKVSRVMSTGTRLQLAAHHAADGEVAHPADVDGAADGFAAEVEAPGGEAVAEGAADGDGGDDAGGEDGDGHGQGARALEGEEGHGEGAADDGDGEARSCRPGRR